MCLLILILPLLGFVSGTFFGFFLNDKGVCIISTTNVFFCFILSFFYLLKIIFLGDIYILTLSEWIISDSLEIKWSFCFDSLTAIMLVIVTTISTLVHLYSIEYMKNDPHLPRFMSYLSLFTFFMLILVTSNNFLQMFIGWEGVGVSSYLLINFWFTRIQANKAAIKAMLINRVGDFSLLISLFTISYFFDSLNYDVVFCLAPLVYNLNMLVLDFPISVMDIICISLFFGAVGKSAQVGLHTWLPDAMEGPTPVSALIHAATMVTAGVFLITRCSYLFEFSSLSLNIILVFGSITALLAATTGLFQNDIKKVIAYSTCSQLGYMTIACGLSGYDVSLFHLSNHAFFKALLFLSAGTIIHSLSNEQDMRKLGGLKNLLPFSYAVVFIGSLALMGFPSLAGFYSKDVILELSFAKSTSFGYFAYNLGVLSAFVTAFYSSRLLYIVFLSVPNENKNMVVNAHEGKWKINFPLFFLMILSIFIGYTTKDLFIGFGSNFWGTSLFILPQNYHLQDIEFLNTFQKILPLILTILGFSFSYFIFRYEIKTYYLVKQNFLFKIIYTFFNKKWYFDRIYNQFLSQNILSISYFFIYFVLDRGIIEKLGPTSIVLLTKKVVEKIIVLQSGFIVHYLTYVLTFIFFSVFISLNNLNFFFIFLFYCILLFYKNIKV